MTLDQIRAQLAELELERSGKLHQPWDSPPSPAPQNAPPQIAQIQFPDAVSPPTDPAENPPMRKALAMPRLLRWSRVLL